MIAHNSYIQAGAANDQRVNNVEVTFAWIIAVVTLLYMLPWAVAATRGKSNSVAIALLNLLLGWTFIGWVAALVMACASHQPQLNMVQMVNAPAYYQQPPYQR
jgi:uncharacterized membrane protein